MGSAQVPLERPVLRPPGRDNSAHRQVARQPWTPIGTFNPGRVTLPRMIPYLWTTGQLGSRALCVLALNLSYLVQRAELPSTHRLIKQIVEVELSD